MFKKKTTEFVKEMVEGYIQEGDICVDLTTGNGYDTLFLGEKVGVGGKVYGFDIQKQAINNTMDLLKKYDIEEERVVLINDSHSKIKEYVCEEITVAMMNLGYLPSGDKSIITKPKTTVKAIEDTLELLKKEGILTIVLYYGHEGGKVEKEAVEKYLKNLNQRKYESLRIECYNRGNCAPIIHGIMKK